ncbi:MBL fold metallo-hydrolase [Desulfurobacterium sp.]
MKIRIAGGYGSKGENYNLVTLIISESMAIDCGHLFAEGTDLSSIKTILITHSHFDHIQDLPFFIDKLPYDKNRKEPLEIYANEEVNDTLKRFIFNGTVWPELKHFKLPSKKEAVRMKKIDAEPFSVENFEITPIPVNHTVKTTGFKIISGNRGVAVSGDTYSTENFWKMVNSDNRIKAVFVDVSYPSSMEKLARTAKHYSVRKLLEDLERFGIRDDIDIYAYHLKYPFIEAIKNELRKAERNINSVCDGKIIEV